MVRPASGRPCASACSTTSASVYIQIAREMLQRHDCTSRPHRWHPLLRQAAELMYWMAAASMRIFGASTTGQSAYFTLALGISLLLFAVYALGIRLFAAISSPRYPDRGGLYAALAIATSIGPYLYTRFYIPDILIALWMTLSIHLFLIALDRAHSNQHSVILSRRRSRHFASAAAEGPARTLTRHKPR